MSREYNNGKLLKISEVYSNTRLVGNETSMNIIRVKTPGQINANGSVNLGVNRVIVQQAKTPQKPLIVKRLGNTSIRGPAASFNGPKFSEALKAQIEKISNEVEREKQTKPVVKNITTYFAEPDTVRHNRFYYDQLQKNNMEMRKTLIECKREAALAHTKIQQLSMVVATLLKKLENITIPNRGIGLSDRDRAFFEPEIMTAVNQNRPKVKATHNEQSSFSIRKYQLPIFPIQMLATLNRFEANLRNSLYSRYVYESIMESIHKPRMAKPSDMISHILKYVITNELLEDFVWDLESVNNVKGQKTNVFSELYNFKSLLITLANGLSRLLYGRNLRLKAIENFLKTKLKPITNFVTITVPSYAYQKRPSTATTSKPLDFVKASTILDCKELKKSPVSESDNDVKTQSQEIQWIYEDNEMGEGEDIEMESSIVDNQDDDSDEAVVSVIDEHDFEFLDC